MRRNNADVAFSGVDKAPVFDGRGSPFSGPEQQARLRICATETEPASRALLLVLCLHSAPRQVCLAEGGDVLGRHDGAARIMGMLRSYSAPDAADAFCRQVMRFPHYRRADQSIGEYIAELDLLRRKAES